MFCSSCEESGDFSSSYGTERGTGMVGTRSRRPRAWRAGFGNVPLVTVPMIFCIILLFESEIFIRVIYGLRRPNLHVRYDIRYRAGTHHHRASSSRYLSLPNQHTLSLDYRECESIIRVDISMNSHILRSYLSVKSTRFPRRWAFNLKFNLMNYHENLSSITVVDRYSM